MLKAALVTIISCACQPDTCCPVRTFQMRSLPSAPPQASSSPSLLKVMHAIPAFPFASRGIQGAFDPDRYRCIVGLHISPTARIPSRETARLERCVATRMESIFEVLFAFSRHRRTSCDPTAIAAMVR